ncbi:unnamed protein product, partial [Nesidiocoris tenuis]
MNFFTGIHSISIEPASNSYRGKNQKYSSQLSYDANRRCAGPIATRKAVNLIFAKNRTYRQDNAESRESSEQAESESEDNPYHRRGISAQEGLLWKRSLNNAERALSMTRKRLQSGRLADA